MDSVLPYLPLFMAVAVGGALGSMARAGLGLWLSPRWSAHWVTLGINLSGSFVIGGMFGAIGGALGGAGALALALAEPVWVFGAVGVLGGYTTVSSFALQANALWRGTHRQTALAYVTLSALGGPLAAALGWLVFVGISV